VPTWDLLLLTSNRLIYLAYSTALLTDCFGCSSPRAAACWFTG